MAKKKIDFVNVKVTGPNCWLGDKQILPGETADVPAGLAQEWVNTGRAVYTAEVTNGDGSDSQ